MTATYRGGNLSFLYPENWRISESDADWTDGTNQVTLEGPTGGLWIMHALAAGADAAEVIREIMSAINACYEGVEWSEVDAPLFGFESSGHDGYFYSLDLLVCVRIRTFRSLDRTVIVVVQSESRDFDRLEDVYNAITLSLCQSMAAVRG